MYLSFLLVVGIAILVNCQVGLVTVFVSPQCYKLLHMLFLWLSYLLSGLASSFVAALSLTFLPSSQHPQLYILAVSSSICTSLCWSMRNPSPCAQLGFLGLSICCPSTEWEAGVVGWLGVVITLVIIISVVMHHCCWWYHYTAHHWCCYALSSSVSFCIVIIAVISHHLCWCCHILSYLWLALHITARGHGALLLCCWMQEGGQWDRTKEEILWSLILSSYGLFFLSAQFCALPPSLFFVITHC